MKDLLANVKDQVFTHAAHGDQSLNDMTVNQVAFAKLLTDLEGDVDWANS